jgi:hypothetical protein
MWSARRAAAALGLHVCLVVCVVVLFLGWVEGVECLVPCRQSLARVGVEVSAAVVVGGWVPLRHTGIGVHDGVYRGPPHLCVGGGRQLLDQGAREGAADPKWA